MQFWERNWTLLRDSEYPRYLDMDSVKVREYNGRKYLELMYGFRDVERTYCRQHMILDIEHQKEVCLGKWVLVIRNDKVIGESQLYSGDISAITKATPENWKNSIEIQAIQWVEQNRPDVIDEIRTFNRSGQSATNVAGAAGGSSSGSMQDIVGDIEYEVLDSGAVRFNVRCMTDMSPDDYSPLYEPSYYIFAKPEKYNALPGAYLMGREDRTFADPTIQVGAVCYYGNRSEDAFDYDPKTQTFTFYAWETPSEARVDYRMRVIDKNTVRITYYSYDFRCNVTNTHKYIPYDKIPAVKSIDGYCITVRDDSWINDTWYDRNKYVWCGDHFPYFWEGGILTPVVDMARAFLAVNGNVGTAPEGYNLSFHGDINDL